MRQKIGVVVLTLVVALLAACSEPGEHELPTLDNPGDLSMIKSRGELVIVTRNAPTVTYIDRDGRMSGPEHDGAAAFAKFLGVAPRFVTVNSVADLLNAVENGKADMAAGSITVTKERQQRFEFGPEYGTVWQQVVCNNKNKPRKLADLVDVNKLVVGEGTSYVSQLQQLAKENPKLNLTWIEKENTSTEVLMADVANGKYGCTIADSNLVAINRRFYPSLLVMFRISDAQHLAWPMPKGADYLRQAAIAWGNQFKKTGKLEILRERYYGYIGNWDFTDTNALVTRTKKVYPRYDKYFTKAAEDYDFDKWLLAAQAYQESHWDPMAVSYTGVRGIMMLTMSTAKAMGVSDRLDPEQSINGGAAYLRKMEERLSDKILPPDRYYFALASYNVGLGHVRDAMTLARRQGRNPYLWRDVSKTLPLLMKPKYYNTVKYGYARGNEPVRYVARIRNYSDIIRRLAKE